MNFIEELTWRGMLHDTTPGVSEYIDTGMVTGYIGFDPTAPSLTIGNYVQVMLLTLFQKHGHQPIFLLGGATGRIGDPSGKDAERILKTYEELDSNLAFQQKQAARHLNFEDGENKAIMLNNHDFYKDMNILEFLRVAGKNLTVSYMLSKESVKKRLESGLSFTEFSYQLLQAYDFLYLYRKYNCRIQMGGSDQWGNITSGTEFIRRNIDDGKAYAVTTPLLTKADGSKFGKSTSGNIWLDPKLTSPYKFYQFWINAADADIPKFMRYFTFKSKEEVEALEKQYADDPRALKKELAAELTERIHSAKGYQSVMHVSDILFNKHATADALQELDADTLGVIAEEIQCFDVPKDALANGIDIATFATEHTQIAASKGDVRRAIKNNALSVNKNKVTTHEMTINHEHLLEGSYIMIENGKKNKYMIKAV